MKKPQYAICKYNKGPEVSLEVRKLFEIAPDPEAEATDFIRVNNESGEDYPYPAKFYLPIPLPDSAGVTVSSLS